MTSGQRLGVLLLGLGYVLGSMTNQACGGPSASVEPTHATPQKLRISDEVIRDAVHRELRAKRDAPVGTVAARVFDGVVILEGEVPTLRAREWAGMLAEGVRGVRSVVNLLAVRPAQGRTDEQIRSAAEDALRKAPATDPFAVNVWVDDSRVVLRGLVDSRAEAKLAEDVVAGVRGVSAIRNELAVRATGPRDDTEMEREITARLRNDALLDPWRVDVRVNEGVATLRGSVGSFAQKRRAIANAWVRGVEGVSATALQVDIWEPNENRRTEVATPSERELENAVAAAFRFDPRVRAKALAATADGATVRLMGEVASEEEKRAAEADARGTVGVERVESRIVVRGSAVDARPSAPATPPGAITGVACGSNTCAPGAECCNPECGICVPPGTACTTSCEVRHPLRWVRANDARQGSSAAAMCIAAQEHGARWFRQTA